MKLFIFGATGDLVKKKVFPALEEIKNLEIISLGRKELNNKLFNSEYCVNCSNQLKNRLNYKKISFKDNFCDECTNLFDEKEINYFYISLPPNLIYEVLNEVAKLKEKNYKIRILIEKPFGNNLDEANKLKKLIINKNLQDEIYLADHYLFKEDVLRLNVTKKIERIEIASLEKEGINKRFYYDDVGAIKDMIQSHLLNILFKILEIKDEDKISFEIKKLKIGQYKEYEEEINKKSNTETYAKIEGIIVKNNEDKIQIVLETGKKLDKKEIIIKIDNKKMIINEKTNPYLTMFNRFLKGDIKNFPKIEQAIKTWKITEEIIKYIKNNKVNLERY